MDNALNPFIFYLTLEENLPRSFYVFDRTLREQGFILVPVRVDQLQTLVSSTEQNHIFVMSSIVDSRELKIFNERVRGLLKFILKSKRMTFLQLSSFGKVNDTKHHHLGRNYLFLKYPLDAKVLSTKIKNHYQRKNSETLRWPGGHRAGVIT